MARKANDNMAKEEENNMIGKADRDFSRLICKTLDTFGFDRESISFRSKFYENLSHLTDKHSYRDGIPNTIVFAGSLGEGVGLVDSDLDTMCIIADALCVDRASENRQFNILEADYTASSPGYTKIISAYSNKDSKSSALINASHSFESRTRRPYVSSTIFKNYVNQWAQLLASEHYAGLESEDITTNGPAVTRKVFTIGEHDIVACMYFYGGKYTSNWAKRVRFFQWPSSDLVREVSESEGYIVPVGDKLSETQTIEWRICYTTAEKKLTSSLNGVQMKLYILLKLIGKKILKPVCKEITSYVVKNIVFWIVETTPAEQFSPELLVTLLMKSLYFIKHCLINNHFPNYMIPDRNLLAVVHGANRHRIICFISECLKDGAKIVLRLPAFRKCIVYTSFCAERRLYRKMRNDAEKLVFEVLLQRAEYYDVNLLSRSSVVFDIEGECLRNEPLRFMESRLKLLNILVPEWPELVGTGRLGGIEELFMSRFQSIWLL